MRAGAASVHVLAAVHRDVAAGHVGGGVTCDEGDERRDFVGFTEAPDRDGADDLGENILGDRCHHLGGEIAGRDRVDGNSLPATS